jgi:CelD/BcsL family acetyltransferase involved in cellulose biosynthesis
MDVQVHTRVADVAAAWEELARDTGAPPWLWPGWIDAWWRAFGRGHLELLTVHRAGELAAILPLARHTARRASATNWHTPAFAPLARDADALAALTRAAFLPSRTAMLTLRPVPADGPELAALRTAAGEASYRLIEHVDFRSPYIPLDGDFAGFLARSLPGRGVLKDIRRCRRRLEEVGEVAFEAHDGSERLEALLEEGFAVEAAGWQGASDSAISSRPETHAFYSAIARWAADRGKLQLMFLRVDGRAVAFEYVLCSSGVLYDLKGGYLLEHRKLGPGKLLTLEAIEWCYARDLRGFDYLGRDDPYKLQWTDQVRERWVLRAFAPSPVGRAAWATWALGRPVARRALAAAGDRAARRGDATRPAGAPT